MPPFIATSQPDALAVRVFIAGRQIAYRPKPGRAWRTLDGNPIARSAGVSVAVMRHAVTHAPASAGHVPTF